MIKIKIVFAIFIIIGLKLKAQNLPVPQSMGNTHPRSFLNYTNKETFVKNIENEAWSKAIIDKVKSRVSLIIEQTNKGENWLVSRLQMNWNTKADQPYINGGVFARTEGEAPFPTIKYPGARNHTTNYKRPKLKDVKPYMDDPRGLYLQHRDRSNRWEWAGISKTGRIIESINREILSIAKDAAFLYWYTNEEKYAELAYTVLDTYLTGVYYSKVPIDISHGHHQTLVGYTSFEVIQEHIIEDVTACYDYLHGYIQNKDKEKLNLFEASFQKWADQIIKNGVSFNNWNLLQAAHISKIAMILEDNDQYKNGKGGAYYLDQIMNKTSTRQWSMQQLINYGYDTETGIWNESPGYSMNVLNDFIHFAKFYDHKFNIDLIAEIPVLKQAVISSSEYLYPNKYKVAFGDGHYGYLRSEPILYMIENAQKYNKIEDEQYFTKMLKTIYDEKEYNEEFKGSQISDLFSKTHFSIKENIEPGKLSEFQSPLFYAPNTSWLVQRQGEEEEDALMISQIGSLGNHMHSNGIAIELYGKGLPLAPEMGHGSSYFSIEYAEYYTQFPAHNTVIVNGKSKYPEMKSNHAFEVLASYPKSQEKQGVISGYTFSDVSFLETETQSDQRRLTGIIKNDYGGFYVDVFRSKQKDGKDVKHEYFYHNLGQGLTLRDNRGVKLALQPTNKLAFGDGDLMAYDYMWDKKSIETNLDFNGQFNLKMDDRTVSMNLWIKGENNREIFSVKSPHSTAFRHGPLPEEFNNNSIPTLVVKQNGEAWNRPFVAIYEPALNGESYIASVDYFGTDESVGIHIKEKNDRETYIFSNVSIDEVLIKGNMYVKGTYGIIRKKEENFTLFLGNGKEISIDNYKVETIEQQGAASLEKINNQLFFTSDIPVILTIPSQKAKKSIKLTDGMGNNYFGKYYKKTKTVSFELPALPYGLLKINI